MIRVVIGVFGALLVVVTWSSILRTVFLAHGRTSRAAGWSLRLVMAGGHRLIRRLPVRRRNGALDALAPVTLFVMAGGWLASLGAGLLAVSWAAYGGPVGLSDPFLPRHYGAMLLTSAVWLSVALSFAAITAHLAQFLAAFRRREIYAARIAYRAPTGEMLLASYLSGGSREGIDGLFTEATRWLIDVQHTHVGNPALLCARSPGCQYWVSTAVSLLDSAALTCAVAPEWAPPSARPLLSAGMSCLRQLADQLGIERPSAPVSLEGREECSFSDSVSIALRAGLPVEQGGRSAWDAFQDFRVRYAPYGAAIAARLLYLPVVDIGEELAPFEDQASMT